MTTDTAEIVRKALDADGRITSKTIHVSAEDGSIVLHGVVDSLAELGIAQEIAEAAAGVKSIENHLKIDGEVDTGPCCPQM
ncbi:MAG: BON domain-containing protein [Armatimonadota bacterium]|nr:BON domain-containing protein [Armatimonadota bacterium]